MKKKMLFAVLMFVALAVSAFAPMRSPRPRAQEYVAVFIQDGKMAFDDGHEAIVTEGTMLYHFAWRPDGMRYGCLTWLQSPSTCGVTRAENVRRVEP